MTADLGAPHGGPAGVSAPHDGLPREAVPPDAAERDAMPDDVVPEAAMEGDSADESPSALRRRVMREVLEWLAVGVCALGLALFLKAFLVEVFEIPSGSMEPTLMIDDRVVVYKLGYRFGDVNRGDVVVFHMPGQASNADDLIKRVVALGGETLEIRDGRVYIDGDRLEEPYLKSAQSTYPGAPIQGCANAPEPDRCEVPEGKLLVLGDSREASRDGRYFGPIDVDTVVGRAFLKIWPPNDLGGV